MSSDRTHCSKDDHGAEEQVMEATPYFRLDVRIAPSSLPGAGLGAFALEGVAKGALLGLDLPHVSWMVSAEDALKLSREARSQTWRHVEDICFRGGEGVVSPSNYLNHSFQPNVLWHLGCYWALAEIHPGDELLLDYRPLIDPAWSGRIIDAASGRPLIGKEGREALLESAKALVDLLESVSDEPTREKAPELAVSAHAIAPSVIESEGSVDRSTP